MKKLKLLFLALIILFSCDTGDKSPDTNFKIIHVSAESSRASREDSDGFGVRIVRRLDWFKRLSFEAAESAARRGRLPGDVEKLPKVLNFREVDDRNEVAL